MRISRDISHLEPIYAIPENPRLKDTKTGVSASVSASLPPFAIGEYVEPISGPSPYHALTRLSSGSLGRMKWAGDTTETGADNESGHQKLNARPTQHQIDKTRVRKETLPTARWVWITDSVLLLAFKIS